tara:strand:+ start:21369 stop:21560 length:192 start_codon:yes stop_codon:yes gene_type:complete
VKKMNTDMNNLRANANEMSRVRRSLLPQRKIFQIDEYDVVRTRRLEAEDGVQDLVEIFKRQLR